MSNDIAILYIKDELMDMKMPNPWFKRYPGYFKQYSYTKWAYTECIKTIREHPNQAPLVSIDELYDKFDKFSCNGERAIMFSVAKDAVENIIDMLTYCV